MSTEWYLTKPSYFSGYEKEEIEEVYGVFDEFLSQSPETYSVNVDGKSKDVIIQSTSNYNERRVLFRENDLQWGDLIEFQNDKWLVTERPINNRIHDKSHIKLCNNALAFKEIVREIIGRDPVGNPIYGDGEEVITEFPCVAESISDLNTRSTTGEQINIPEGDMVLQITNTQDEKIEIGSTFEMYDNNYRISGIDRSKVHIDKGVLILVVSRVTNTNN